MAFKTKAEKAFDEKLSAAIDAHDWNEVEKLFSKLASVIELIEGEHEAGYCVSLKLTPRGIEMWDEDDDDDDLAAEAIATANEFFELLNGKTEEPIGDYLSQLDKPDSLEEQANTRIEHIPVGDGRGLEFFTIDSPRTLDQIMDDVQAQVKAKYTCGVCGQPARGLASITVGDKETFYCHEGSSPTCYEKAKRKM